MPKYDDQQSRLSSSFNGHRTLTVQTCQCGRLHFVSADGHGDYEPGELEDLLAKAEAEPEKYVEEAEFDHIDAVYIEGWEIVPDCPCAAYKRYCDWIENHAEELAEYLTRYFQDKKADAMREAKTADRLAAAIQKGE